LVFKYSVHRAHYTIAVLLYLVGARPYYMADWNFDHQI